MNPDTNFALGCGNATDIPGRLQVYRVNFMHQLDQRIVLTTLEGVPGRKVVQHLGLVQHRSC